LIFTKTGVGGTDFVWFYDVAADGYSLDDKRQQLLPDDKMGPQPVQSLSDEEQFKNSLPDVASRWKNRAGAERLRSRRDRSFCVEYSEIVSGGNYDLTVNHYREIESHTTTCESPEAIIAELREIESQVAEALKELERSLA
jgi:type I restriction enzyme M protein